MCESDQIYLNFTVEYCVLGKKKKKKEYIFWRRSLPVCGISRVVPVYFNCCDIIVSLFGINLVTLGMTGSLKNQQRQKERQKSTDSSPGTKTHIEDQSLGLRFTRKETVVWQDNPLSFINCSLLHTHTHTQTHAQCLNIMCQGIEPCLLVYLYCFSGIHVSVSHENKNHPTKTENSRIQNYSDLWCMLGYLQYIQCTV